MRALMKDGGIEFFFNFVIQIFVVVRFDTSGTMIPHEWTEELGILGVEYSILLATQVPNKIV